MSIDGGPIDGSPIDSGPIDSAPARRAPGRRTDPRTTTGAGPRRTRRTRAALLATGLAIPLALAGCTNNGGAQTAAATSTVASGGGSGDSSAIKSLQNTYEQVIRNVRPSVVEITTNSALGSGIVFDAKGDIVTNDHVVGSANQFQVYLADSTKPRTATLVGTYPPDDLAVIRLQDTHDLHPAQFADSSTVAVGQIVLAIGNPLGLASSVTNGIVSAVGRTVSEPQSGSSPGATLPEAIQTSAAINPGNSGGALVDLNGKVIGIPTLAALDPELGGSAAPGIGFAIPSNIVKDIAGQLANGGKVTNSHRAFLGIQPQTVVNGSGRPVGVGVVSVEPGGPADKAGLQAGDVIVSLAGHQVASTQELATVLANLDVGKTVPVEVVGPGGQHRTVQVTLGQLSGS